MMGFQAADVPATVLEQSDMEASDFCAVALYDYVPQNADELTLSMGDKIQVTGKSAEWWTGTGNEGSSGMFPAAYARECDASFEFKYYALYDYEAINEEELTVASGELLAVQHQTDDGWTGCVSLDGKGSGLVPTKYLEHLGTNPDEEGTAAGGTAADALIAGATVYPAETSNATVGSTASEAQTPEPEETAISIADTMSETGRLPVPRASLPVPRASAGIAGSTTAAAEGAGEGERRNGSSLVPTSVLDSLLDSDDDADA